MAIKKPVITKKTTGKMGAPPPSKLKKRPREEEEPEEQEDDDDAEPEEEEEPAPKKKKKSTPVDEEEYDDDDDDAEPEEEEEAPRRKGSAKKKKKSSKSFADIFDSTKPGRGLLAPGDYKANVTGFELEGDIADDAEDQGELKIKVTYTIHEDEDDEVAGKTISQRYQLCGEDGEAGPGIPFLKGDLDVLGYEDVILEDLQQICEDVEAEQPEVLIKVKQNGQYTNAYLQGLAEE